MSFLSIQRIRKEYDRSVAVCDLSLEVKEGEFLTFLGPSGSGKSTTLYIIAGLMEPTAGDVLLNGKSLLRVPPNKRNIGMVFQRYTLFPHMSVAENVAFPLLVRKRLKTEIDGKVAEMLRLTRLEDYRDRRPSQLSGGQQQRVALARALIYDPPILLMDEPLSALDKRLREEIQVEIKRLHEQTGVTILYVTHDQDEALRLSDRIALFNLGRVEQLGTGHNLYSFPRSRFVGSFIGNSNFFPVTILSHRDGLAKIACPDGATFDGVPCIGEQNAQSPTMMIRPERIRLERTTQDVPNAINGNVMNASFLGDSILYTVVTRWSSEVSVRTSVSQVRPDVARDGDQVVLRWNTHDAAVFL